MIPFGAYFIPRHQEGVTERGDQSAAKAAFEYLYDRPYEDWGIVLVVVPFTVERLSPHRTLGVEASDEPIDHLAGTKTVYDEQQHSSTIILEHLNTDAYPGGAGGLRSVTPTTMRPDSSGRGRHRPPAAATTKPFPHTSSLALQRVPAAAYRRRRQTDPGTTRSRPTVSRVPVASE